MGRTTGWRFRWRKDKKERKEGKGGRLKRRKGRTVSVCGGGRGGVEEEWLVNKKDGWR